MIRFSIRHSFPQLCFCIFLRISWTHNDLSIQISRYLQLYIHTVKKTGTVKVINDIDLVFSYMRFYLEQKDLHTKGKTMCRNNLFVSPDKFFLYFLMYFVLIFLLCYQYDTFVYVSYWQCIHCFLILNLYMIS